MTRTEHAARSRRESLAKRLGATARRIAARDAHACVYCGATAETSGAHLHLDHVTPRARGGADVASNLVLACRRCNSARQALSLAGWQVYAASLGIAFEARTVRARLRRVLPALTARAA